MSVNRIQMMLGLLLLFVGSSLPIHAQFNPDNPEEPNSKYQVVLSSDPEDIAYLSGWGFYQPGKDVEVNTSSNRSDMYKFLYWTKDGERVCDTPTYQFTMPAKKVNLVAHYAYIPDSPDDPNANNVYRLYLKSEPEGICSFNIASGAKHPFDNYVELCPYTNPGYQFLGWYENGIKISDDWNFYYLMPTKDVTLTAKYIYNPSNPDEPFGDGSQTDIANGKKGDVNGDGSVNVSDAIDLIQAYIGNTTDTLNFSIADVDGNGVINVSDAIEIIDIYINNK